ncbi:DMT family transporter [Cognatishimia sp.]|uniref:DMT family transporter n=1 Tax=Cognatishimia sp. TaxID=2211648 RepID=UPI003519719A
MHGILLRLAAVTLITAMSAIVHQLAKTLPVGQIMFWRSGVAAVVIIAFALRFGGARSLRPQNYGNHAIRGLLGGLSMALSFTSLAYLPVANASALAYLAPLLSLPLAAWVLGERMTNLVVFAAILGLGGVALMLWAELEKPDFARGSLIGMSAGLGFAFVWALVRIHIKRMSSKETSASISLSFAITSMAMGLATLPFGWTALGPTAIWLLICAGLLGALGHILSVEAVKRAKVSTLAPFDYFGLIVALGLDALLFSVLPGSLAFVGMLVIVAAGLLAIWQETRPVRSGD